MKTPVFPPGPGRQRGSRGFSLVELCMVVTMIGLMLTFSIPAFHHFRVSGALPGASRELVSQLKLARQKAIARSSTFGVRVDAANNRFQSYDPSAPINTSWTQLDRTVSIQSVSGVTGGLFVFDYNGRLGTTGQVILASAAGTLDTVSLSLSGRVREP